MVELALSSFTSIGGVRLLFGLHTHNFRCRLVQLQQIRLLLMLQWWQESSDHGWIDASSG